MPSLQKRSKQMADEDELSLSANLRLHVSPQELRHPQQVASGGVMAHRVNKGQQFGERFLPHHLTVGLEVQISEDIGGVEQVVSFQHFDDFEEKRLAVADRKGREDQAEAVVPRQYIGVRHSTIAE